MARPAPHVLAAVERPVPSSAVEDAADVLARRLGVARRTVHVSGGRGWQGAAREAALARVALGESDVVPGSPEVVLRALAESDSVRGIVLGTPRRSCTVPASTVGSGTAFALARRLRRPVLLVPAEGVGWCGPHHVLLVLDGRLSTALSAADALSELGPPTLDVATVHVPDPGDARGGVEESADAVLAVASDMRADMVVLVWARQRTGREAQLVDSIVTRSLVPVMLIPAESIGPDGARAER